MCRALLDDTRKGRRCQSLEARAGSAREPLSNLSEHARAGWGARHGPCAVCPPVLRESILPAHTACSMLGAAVQARFVGRAVRALAAGHGTARGSSCSPAGAASVRSYAAPLWKCPPGGTSRLVPTDLLLEHAVLSVLPHACLRVRRVVGLGL